jgi:hypothetical protein
MPLQPMRSAAAQGRDRSDREWRSRLSGKTLADET